MQTGQQEALADVLRLNAQLSAEKSARKPDQGRIDELTTELDVARVILAIERGLSGLTAKGRKDVTWTDDLCQRVVSYLYNRYRYEGHRA